MLMLTDARTALVPGGNLNRRSPGKLRIDFFRDEESEGGDEHHEELNELDSLLPWGLGSVIETFANTLDEIISEAMEPRSQVEPVADDTEDEEPASSSSTHWSISWNDIFGDDTDDDDTNGASDVVATSTRVPRQDEDRANTQAPPQSDLHKLQKELRRYKKQNGHLRRKISTLEAELERALPRHDVQPDADDVMTMQIEHLLAQKSKLGYENDALKRENKRLEELVDFFLGTAGQEDAVESPSETDDSWSVDS